MSGLGAGQNIAMQVPSRQFRETVRFYDEVVGLARIEEDPGTVVFAFGDKRLWIDSREDLVRAEVWLELVADDADTAAGYLAERGVVRRDEVEALPKGFAGFWICNPAGVIHLVSER